MPILVLTVMVTEPKTVVTKAKWFVVPRWFGDPPQVSRVEMSPNCSFVDSLTFTDPFITF